MQKMFDNKIKSPITNSYNIKLIKNINTKNIIIDYQKILPNIQVSLYFRDIKKISIYECIDTGYQFFYPYIEGSDIYYSKLGNLAWYYSAWKWEHNIALNYIKENSNLLEVGSGKGGFILSLKEKIQCNSTGLELNPDIKKITNEYNINLLNETIQVHSKNNIEKYDIVCSFQVLEHISGVNNVINSMIKSLKPKGKLIISVPNNDSFIKDNPLPSKVLNMPPHHVGLWNKTSLTNLTKYFNIKLIEIKEEPLQESSVQTYISTKFYKIFKSQLLLKIFNKLKVGYFISKFIKKEKITGHTIIAIYEKN